MSTDFLKVLHMSLPGMVKDLLGALTSPMFLRRCHFKKLSRLVHNGHICQIVLLVVSRSYSCRRSLNATCLVLRLV